MFLFTIRFTRPSESYIEERHPNSSILQQDHGCLSTWARAPQGHFNHPGNAYSPFTWDIRPSGAPTSSRASKATTSSLPSLRIRWPFPACTLRSPRSRPMFFWTPNIDPPHLQFFWLRPQKEISDAPKGLGPSPVSCFSCPSRGTLRPSRLTQNGIGARLVAALLLLPPLLASSAVGCPRPALFLDFSWPCFILTAKSIAGRNAPGRFISEFSPRIDEDERSTIGARSPQSVLTAAKAPTDYKQLTPLQPPSSGRHSASCAAVEAHQFGFCLPQLHQKV